MRPPFNLYDFLAYLIPGTFLIALLYWIAIGLFGLEFDLPVSGIGESILFVIIAYFAGHLAQIGGNWIEGRATKQWGGLFSVQLLSDSCDHYSPMFKAKVRRLIESMFGFADEIFTGDSEEHKRQRLEAFNLCYSLVLYENTSPLTEVFNGIYGLYRGVQAMLQFGICVSIVIGLKQLVVLLGDGKWPSTFFFQYRSIHLALAVVVLISSLLVIGPLTKRWQRFSRHFADSVYRSFCVWCAKNGRD